MTARRPLEGLTVLELGQLLAGPFCGFMLAGFGATVIKVEPPGVGDAIRRWRVVDEGTSLWWRSLARDKYSVTANLREDRGREIVRDLIRSGVDVVIENFRPGRMEAWGLGPEDLHAIDPRVIMVRISGYGQDGPYASRPGFANIAEAFAGLRHLTAEPGRPPVRGGVSLGDTNAGMHAAYATLAAVYERDVGGSGKGQVIDVALYESMFNMMESLLPEYDRAGIVRQPTGGALPGIVPSNTYRCSDGRIVIGANSTRLFVSLMRLIDRNDLADDPQLQHNDGRTARVEAIDAAIEGWTSARSCDDALAALRDAEVPSGPINTIADIAGDPHVQAREMMPQLPLPGGDMLRVPAVVPKMSRTPPGSRWLGPELGQHNEDIYQKRLGYDAATLASLREDGII
ncbi:MAG: CaiB/BaiF CoA-transferase family protein [Myxococcota bacterium]